MNRVLALPLFVCVLLIAGGSRAATADLSFANKVADQLRQAIPGYNLTVVDDLTIKAGKSSQPAEQPMQINLDRVADYCARTPDGCDRMVSDFVAKMALVIKEQDFTPAASKLRAVVRPASYLAQMTTLLATKGDELISAPFAGDVAMMCYFDQPTAMRPALKSDLAKIGLTRDRALQLCLDNTRSGLPRLPSAPQGPSTTKTGSFNYLQGDPYESSYLLLHDEWTPLAEKLGGHLLVAAPDADLIVFGADAGATSLDALSTFARQAYAKAERPISAKVFRWTPSGWEVAVP
jgi:uncharacterized protein YtpQ (UPF0354 family)